jgi:thiol:disulfide interchange protein DsbA
MMLVGLAGLVPTLAAAQAAPFVEGRHFTRLTPAVPPSTPPGTVEVVEVFSYGCPACWQALPVLQRMKKLLPAKAQFVYIPASFKPSEAWPMFQRAYLTAQALGVADKVHEEMFDAIWRTGEIPLVDTATGRMRPRLPTIEDAARFYAKRTGVKEADFVAASKSFAVETRVTQAEKLMRAYRVDSTPTFVVAGKYKVNGGSYEDIIAITKYLVDRELASAPPAAAAAK